MTQDPFKYFRVEARELLDQLGQGILDMEKGACGPHVVPRLLRLAHTLKGAARVVKQGEIADEAHALEGTLAPFRESAADMPRERIDELLKFLDRVAVHVTALTPPAEVGGGVQTKVVHEESTWIVRADAAEMDALLDGMAEIHSQVGGLEKSLAEVERARHLADFLIEELAPRRRRDSGRPADDRDRAYKMAQELRLTWGRFDQGLGTAVDQIDREVRQVREAAEGLRLIPAGTLFTSLERVARDAARALGKRVAFQAQGGDLRLDAHMLGVVQGALLQVIRNAVAHGVEPLNERTAAGKPAEGRVTLDVGRRGRRVAFVCKDDGRGVDLEAVRLAAQRRGLSVSEVQDLGAEELLRLLLKGGISTSVAVTEVAGRGIGLDVVREAAERLSGEATVHTEAGSGTTVEIVVPMSLASLPALAVDAAGNSVTIPLDAVRRALSVAPRELARTAKGESVIFEGQMVPFVSLPMALSGNRVAPRDGRPRIAVIVQGHGGLAAVGVDRLLGTALVVHRPLPDLAPSSPLVAGAYLDPEGTPQLVLDPDGLVAEAQRAVAPVTEPEAVRPPVLVIDDSLTTRMLEQSILESAGYEVHLATSGEEALEKARASPYGLILVDVEMPGMDGFEFLEHARADPGLRDVPAILVTSRASPEDRQRGRDVGARHYIVKSEFDQAELLERIRTILG